MKLYSGQTNELKAFYIAFANTRREMLISLAVLFFITFTLSLVFYLVEHIVQPDVFDSYWSCLVWAYTRYIEGGDGVFEGAPVTVVGRAIAFLLGLIGIAIVAIPAGLIGSGFMDAIAEEKRDRELADYEQRLRKSFARKQCRYTKYRTTPPFVSVVDIQAKQGIDTKDILDTVEVADCFRLRNLATTQPLGEYALDKLVVEHFPKNTAYGCKIDRQSDVTIVSTSSVQEAGIGNFAYYLALFGGFNYVSKEVEVDPDEPFSYYNIKSEDGDPNIGIFLSDIKSMARGEKHWVICLLSASGAEEPAYPEQVHWIHGAKRGDSGYTDANITVRDTASYDAMVKEVSAKLEQDYGLKSDRQKYHAGSSKMYIGRHVQVEGKEVNACTLRMAFGVTIWNDHRIAIARDIAAIMRQQLCNRPLEEEAAWKAKGLGY